MDVSIGHLIDQLRCTQIHLVRAPMRLVAVFHWLVHPVQALASHVALDYVWVRGANLGKV